MNMIYISFANENGGWDEPVNLGSKINTVDDETCPRVTGDGNYFFFTRTKSWDGDFYWIKADFLSMLRKGVYILNLVINKKVYNKLIYVH